MSRPTRPGRIGAISSARRERRGSATPVNWSARAGPTGPVPADRQAALDGAPIVATISPARRPTRLRRNASVVSPRMIAGQVDALPEPGVRSGEWRVRSAIACDQNRRAPSRDGRHPVVRDARMARRSGAPAGVRRRADAAQGRPPDTGAGPLARHRRARPSPGRCSRSREGGRAGRLRARSTALAVRLCLVHTGVRRRGPVREAQTSLSHATGEDPHQGVYEPAARTARLLIMRLWPRGIRRRTDVWLRSGPVCPAPRAPRRTIGWRCTPSLTRGLARPRLGTRSPRCARSRGEGP